MAAIEMPVTASTRIGVLRCTATGIIVLALNFILCWVAGVALTIPATHMFVALFTSAPTESTAALGLGLAAAVVFGGFSGALTALAYNLFDFLAPR